jgi:hypothetical protein
METIEIHSRQIAHPGQFRWQWIGLVVLVILPPLLQFWFNNPGYPHSAFYGIGAALLIGAVIFIRRNSDPLGWTLSANAEYLEIRSMQAQLWSSSLGMLAAWNKGHDSGYGAYLRFVKRDGDLFSVPLANFSPQDIERLLDFLSTHAPNHKLL